MALSFNNTRNQFRSIAMLEGISFLILLFIAMPLKYLANAPGAVRIVGSIHGILFVAFVVLLYLIREKENWAIGKTLGAFLASLVPFGTFWLDKKMAKGEW
jgi:integral membrane protein